MLDKETYTKLEKQLNRSMSKVSDAIRHAELSADLAKTTLATLKDIGDALRVTQHTTVYEDLTWLGRVIHPTYGTGQVIRRDCNDKSVRVRFENSELWFFSPANKAEGDRDLSILKVVEPAPTPKETPKINRRPFGPEDVGKNIIDQFDRIWKMVEGETPSNYPFRAQRIEDGRLAQFDFDKNGRSLRGFVFTRIIPNP